MNDYPCFGYDTYFEAVTIDETIDKQLSANILTGLPQIADSILLLMV